MPNWFQPTDSKKTTSGGPSQAMITLLTTLLDAAGSQQRPSFKEFVGGARMPNALPKGLGTLLAQLGPNAFKKTATETTKPSSPGMVSDLASLLVLLKLMGGKEGVPGAVSSGVSGAKSIWDWFNGNSGAAFQGNSGVTPSSDYSDPYSLASILGTQTGGSDFTPSSDYSDPYSLENILAG